LNHREHGEHREYRNLGRKTVENLGEEKMIEVDQINGVRERIIGAAIEVHRTPGTRLLESTYHACLAHELKQPGLEVETERELPVASKAVTLDFG
jgi:hypothetical protein